MRQIAFLTMDSLAGFWAYDHLAVEPLRRRDCEVHDVSWRRPAVDWSRFELVVIRSPWDYHHRPADFLQTLSAIQATGARLENCLDIVRWNLSKRYLQDLQQRGVQIVPTAWCPGLTTEGLEQLFARFSPAPLVVKPMIGAGGEHTWRLTGDSADPARQRALQFFSEREVLVQPFVPAVVEAGEYSLFYFRQNFRQHYSHCVLKTPQAGEFRVQEEHGGIIAAVEPEADLREAAERTLQCLEWQPLYARVDLVRLADGSPALMELELIEPSLYLASDPQAPERFAEAIVDCLEAC